MRPTPVLFAALAAAAALPAAAQDYFETTSALRTGRGYVPSAIVAGYERDDDFTVIAISFDGDRAARGLAMEWKATVVVGPRNEAEDEDDEYEGKDGEEERLAQVRTAQAQAAARPKPKVERSEVAYASGTCPAIMTRMDALKPLATFEFNPPSMKGNIDGPSGDGREGLDIWIRTGGAELSKSAESANSALGRWFQETAAALARCPATPKVPAGAVR